ncbi:MAG: hypothetical protein R2794_02085 [Chitinophagales bacterium]
MKVYIIFLIAFSILFSCSNLTEDGTKILGDKNWDYVMINSEPANSVHGIHFTKKGYAYMYLNDNIDRARYISDKVYDGEATNLNEVYYVYKIDVDEMTLILDDYIYKIIYISNDSLVLQNKLDKRDILVPSKTNYREDWRNIDTTGINKYL